MSNQHAVIVGAGHAGGSAAALLRRSGYNGSITLIGEEPYVPYQRPPLSKGALKDGLNLEAIELRPLSFYSQSRILFRPNQRAERIVRESRTLVLQKSEALTYDYLILATGARPKSLPIIPKHAQNVHYLRSLTDAAALRREIQPGRRLLVIGGGYIGLEVAASAREIGATVILIERERRLLSRTASPLVAEFLGRYHVERGVRFVLGQEIVNVSMVNEQIVAVTLSDGQDICCDSVLVGIGVKPNDELGRDCGLPCDDGIIVDANGMTADRAVFAIGDVARRGAIDAAHSLRLESVPSALEQAKRAAAEICSQPSPEPEVPWFWSDQYDLKLQLAGLGAAGETTVVRGDPKAARFAVFHLTGGKIQSLEAVNAAPEFMVGRSFIKTGASISPAKLADPSTPMKNVGA